MEDLKGLLFEGAFFTLLIIALLIYRARLKK